MQRYNTLAPNAANEALAASILLGSPFILLAVFQAVTGINVRESMPF